MQLLLDLCLMLSIFGVWMWRDTREQGINVWPHQRAERTLS